MIDDWFEQLREDNAQLPLHHLKQVNSKALHGRLGQTPTLFVVHPHGPPPTHRVPPKSTHPFDRSPARPTRRLRGKRPRVSKDLQSPRPACPGR